MVVLQHSFYQKRPFLAEKNYFTGTFPQPTFFLPHPILDYVWENIYVARGLQVSAPITRHSAAAALQHLHFA